MGNWGVVILTGNTATLYINAEIKTNLPTQWTWEESIPSEYLGEWGIVSDAGAILRNGVRLGAFAVRITTDGTVMQHQEQTLNNTGETWMYYACVTWPVKRNIGS